MCEIFFKKALECAEQWVLHAPTLLEHTDHLAAAIFLLPGADLVLDQLMLLFTTGTVSWHGKAAKTLFPPRFCASAVLPLCLQHLVPVSSSRS